MGQFVINLINSVQGLRKTIVMISLLLLATIFRIKGLISGDNLVDLLKGASIAFFSVNGLEHLTTTVKEYINKDGKKVDEEVVDVSEAK